MMSQRPRYRQQEQVRGDMDTWLVARGNKNVEDAQDMVHVAAARRKFAKGKREAGGDKKCYWSAET